VQQQQQQLQYSSDSSIQYSVSYKACNGNTARSNVTTVQVLVSNTPAIQSSCWQEASMLLKSLLAVILSTVVLLLQPCCVAATADTLFEY
jgi:hypothetical protein